MADWMDADVEEATKNPLTIGQVQRLMGMTAAMRGDLTVLESVLDIKRACADGDDAYAKQIFSELSDAEQNSIWVAPTFGGIFTTDERKIIRNGDNEA